MVKLGETHINKQQEENPFKFSFTFTQTVDGFVRAPDVETASYRVTADYGELKDFNIGKVEQVTQEYLAATLQSQHIPKEQMN